MTTFAAFPSHTMASHDFTLYPYSETWNQNQTYLPPPAFSEEQYLAASTFDTYQAQTAFAQSDQYLPIDPRLQSKAQVQDQSPADSVTNSFDLYNLPHLSHHCDSGASAHSTLSSAIGSPSTQRQQSTEWFPQASFLPEIVQADNLPQAVYAPPGYEFENIPAIHKGCVGELTAIPSSQMSQKIPSESLPIPFVDFKRDEHLDGLPRPLPTMASDAYEEQAARTTPVASTKTPSPGGSAYTSFSSPPLLPSPALQRIRSTARDSFGLTAVHRATTSSTLGQVNAYDEISHHDWAYASGPHFGVSFFSQSSGHFVPPLDHACPSSSLLFHILSTSRPWRKHETLEDLLTKATVADPSLIQPSQPALPAYSPTQFTGSQFLGMQAVQSPQLMGFTHATTPNQAGNIMQSPQQMSSNATGSASPYMRTQLYAPHAVQEGGRRQSVSSVHSRHSQASSVSEESNKGLCPIPTCGRHVKDLKAHMLTHQNERPEKCPIATCEYHIKGFARKYDKNRHTLTHYKGTMVCGFCPGSGSAAEKSFNRADVFKRHLTSVHNVEQTPPNARRRSPSTLSKRAFGHETSGVCSTCGSMFASPQDFYEHLDDCVLRVVQREDPSEAINKALLTSLAEDEEVKATMARHNLSGSVDYSAPTTYDDDDDAEEEEYIKEDEDNDGSYSSRASKSGKGSIKSKKTSAASTNPS